MVNNVNMHESATQADFHSKVVWLNVLVNAVDAVSINHARGAFEDVFQHFDELFTKVIKEVPATSCEEMNLVLAKWTESHNSTPDYRARVFPSLQGNREGTKCSIWRVFSRACP
jgi:hypothetical protein